MMGHKSQGSKVGQSEKNTVNPWSKSLLTPQCPSRPQSKAFLEVEDSSLLLTWSVWIGHPLATAEKLSVPGLGRPAFRALLRLRDSHPGARSGKCWVFASQAPLWLVGLETSMQAHKK